MRADPASLHRLLDANLDRAREGLRVLEDWARFALERPDLVARTKDLRQRLGALHKEEYKLARHSATDPAAGLCHPAQHLRDDPLAVLAANAARVQEALRVLEEFGRLESSSLAAETGALRYRLYDLEVDLLRAARGVGERRSILQECRLYLITSPVEGLESVVAAALEAGVRLVQYRAKEPCESSQAPIDDRGRLAEALSLRRLCGQHGALFLVNDRVDLAMAVDADGVHLGQSDLPPEVARKLLGPERLIGRSTHCLKDLREAVQQGCDYVGVGPVNATPTKPGRAPVGLGYVREAAAECPIPFFAIGGITAGNLAAVIDAGADRVAVVRAITGSSDPRQATSELLELLALRERPRREAAVLP